MEKDNCRGDNKEFELLETPSRLKDISNIFSLEKPILDNVSEIDMP